MNKNKIALRLSLNFAAALLLFSVVIGSVFLVLFRNYTIDVHKDQLLKYAEALAAQLSGDSSRHGMGNGMMGGGNGGMMGCGPYMHLIGRLAETDVWVIDENGNLLTTDSEHGGHGMRKRFSNVSDLPSNAGDLIEEVLTDQTVFSQDFSDVLSQLTLTAGVPVKNQNGQVFGAVLLHSPVTGTNQALNQGLTILGISMVLALFIALLLSFLLSYSFTKPLAKMKAVALRLSQGDYTAQCHIEQNDEIGELSGVIDELAVRLDEASRQSEKLEHMRRSFVANISHELRTPITVIRGSLEALCDKVVTDPEKIDDYHHQMLNEARFLQRLVGDLLDLSRLQNTEFEIEKQPLLISNVLSDVTRSAGHLARSKQVKINTNIENPGLQIQGDYGRLRQMFLIILDNAIKFSPENGNVEVTVSEDSVSIRDYGPGIESDDLPYIFDRFYKTHGEENKTGTGLGLAIAKQIAERHEITLYAENHQDRGAEFIFKISPN